MEFLKIEHITKFFDRFVALRDVTFGAEAGEFICVLGPSGCGKTTALRVIAGLEPPDSGRVFLGGRDVTGLPVSKRNIGIVFQSYALFPNLTAADNIAYGLKYKGLDSREIRKRTNDLLELVGLKESGRKYPSQLSGGQQQRVALARAMALSPQLLLLDEPLSALDAQVRIMLRGEIKQLQQRLGVTTLMVTHDQEEALTMADRILVMDQGRLVQSGTPEEIYDRPANPFVASFIGSMNFIPDMIKDDNGGFRIGDLSFHVEPDAAGMRPGASAMAAIRPEDLMLNDGGRSSLNTYPARVAGVEYRGSLYRVRLSLPLGDGRRSLLDADVPREHLGRFSLNGRSDVPVHFPPDRIRLYATPARA